MTQQSTVLSKFLTDVTAAVLGLAISGIYVAKFGGGFGHPLGMADSLIMISITFLFLFISAIFQKVREPSKDSRHQESHH